MKKFNFKPIASIALAALLLSGCAGLQKMKKNANLIKYKMTPEMLETHAGKVDVAVDGVFPAKYFNKKATLVVTPVVKYQGGEKALAPTTLQGEKINANGKQISFVNGGNYSNKETFAFADDMRVSEVEMRATATLGKKSLDFDPVKIGTGVLATSTQVLNYPMPIIGVKRDVNNTGKYDPNMDVFQRVIPDEYTADIHYLINKAEVRNTELKADDIAKLKEYTKTAYNDQRKKLKGVDISAYASPDGELDLNTKLAEKREKSSTEFLKSNFKKEKIEAQLKTKFTPEDWDGFKELMGKSTIQDKELIMRVLSMYTDPEVREKEIKNLSAAFTALANDILPKLRRAKITASVDLIGRTDEEIAALADSDPSKLTPAELMYAATLTTDKNKQLAIYNSMAKAYPGDWRGFNNAGYTLIKMYKYSDAKSLFEQAEKLKNNEPIIKNNLGAVALFEGDLAKAEVYFGAASGAGDEVNYNLGIIAMKKAQYEKAIKLFGDSDSPNVGLAKILAGDNNGALKSLENCTWEGCYMKEYFKGIVGARTAKENLMFESLQKAVEMNPKLKAKIATDMEFAKYFEDPKFKAIVQ